jgi:DegV family protein with EDD domain
MTPLSSHVCILTDSTAQFTISSFPGQELVRIIPFHIQLNHERYADSKDLKVYDFPSSTRDGTCPQIQPPTPEEFRQVYLSLAHKCHNIITILLSANLSRAFANAQEASVSLRGRLSLPLIDSQTSGVGLGWIVQAAAEAAHRGASVSEIQRVVRMLASQIYSAFCLQSLTYLHQNGHLDPDQAIIGEMLGVTPLFILEKGKLVPIRKARSMRHLIDLMQEFISEFGKLKHIALLKGIIPFDPDARNLRERINGAFPGTPSSEHALSTSLAAILGPRTLGLTVMEDNNSQPINLGQ